MVPSQPGLRVFGVSLGPGRFGAGNGIAADSAGTPGMGPDGRCFPLREEAIRHRAAELTKNKNFPEFFSTLMNKNINIGITIGNSAVLDLNNC